MSHAIDLDCHGVIPSRATPIYHGLLSVGSGQIRRASARGDKPRWAPSWGNSRTIRSEGIGCRFLHAQTTSAGGQGFYLRKSRTADQASLSASAL
jgi:hypothetical protein